MFKSMSIRQKFFAFGGLIVAIALTLGAIGYWGVVRQADELGGVVVTSLALRNHMEGDMMHDALRADVLAALRAADLGKEEMDSVRADLADHTKNFRERIDANKALTLNDAVVAALASVGGKLDAYITSAGDMVELAAKDKAAADAKYPEFLGTFEELEEALSNVSDQIETSAQAAKDSADATAVRARNIRHQGGLKRPSPNKQPLLPLREKDAEA